jgi:hypothetical protein
MERIQLIFLHTYFLIHKYLSVARTPPDPSAFFRSFSFASQQATRQFKAREWSTERVVEQLRFDHCERLVY